MAVISPLLLLSVATIAALARLMLESETFTQYTPAWLVPVPRVTAPTFLDPRSEAVRADLRGGAGVWGVHAGGSSSAGQSSQRRHGAEGECDDSAGTGCRKSHVPASFSATSTLLNRRRPGRSIGMFVPPAEGESSEAPTGVTRANSTRHFG